MESDRIDRVARRCRDATETALWREKALAMGCLPAFFEPSGRRRRTGPIMAH